MIFLRSLLFNLAFYSWTIFCSIAYLPLLLTNARLVMAAARLWIRVSLWLLEKLCGIRYRLEGTKRQEAGTVIYASKHQSAWETLAYMLLFPGCCFVLKKELLYLPLFGWYLSKSRMIAIDRKAGVAALKSMIKAAKRAQAAGRPIIIYPEGTRTAPGATRPYHAGVAALYQALNCPVVPIALNSGLFWGRNSFSKKPGLVRVKLLPAIAPGLSKKALLTTLEQEIETASAALLDPKNPASSRNSQS